MNDEAYWKQSGATAMLQSAWNYLWQQYWITASAQERDGLLPEQKEALDILHRLARESFNLQCSL
jgi:hypothetical protein